MQALLNFPLDNGRFSKYNRSFTAPIVYESSMSVTFFALFFLPGSVLRLLASGLFSSSLWLIPAGQYPREVPLPARFPLCAIVDCHRRFSFLDASGLPVGCQEEKSG